MTLLRSRSNVLMCLVAVVAATVGLLVVGNHDRQSRLKVLMSYVSIGSLMMSTSRRRNGTHSRTLS